MSEEQAPQVEETEAVDVTAPKHKVQEIPLAEIRENPKALRDVDKETESYQAMVDSVRDRGILNPVVVRKSKDEDTGEKFFQLVDGLHRVTSARDAGLTTVPANVIAASDEEVLELQIIGNIHKVETKPHQYATQLKRIMGLRPLMTMSEMARKVNQSEQWVRNRLSLVKIKNPKIADAVDNGQIPLANAYALTKLPEEEQVAFMDMAITEPAEKFVDIINERAKEIRDANRSGQNSKREFKPVAFMRKMTEVKKEAGMIDGEKGGEAAKALIKELKIESPEQAAATMVKWMLHLDDLSVDSQRVEWEANEKEKAERSARRKAQREADKAKKKAEEAEAAKKAQAEAEAELANLG